MAAATSALVRPCPASTPAARLCQTGHSRALSALGLPALRAVPLRASRSSRPVAVTSSAEKKEEAVAVCRSDAEGPK